MHRPKAVRDHYSESLSVNAANLEKQLASKAVHQGEIRIIMDALFKLYDENVDRIVAKCESDMMALEQVPSPLKLFIDCLVEVQKSLNNSLSLPARTLIQQYSLAWEDWM